MIGYRGIVAYAPRGLKRAGGCGMKEEEKCSSSFEGYNHMRLVINSAVTISRTTSKQASKHSKQAGRAQPRAAEDGTAQVREGGGVQGRSGVEWSGVAWVWGDGRAVGGGDGRRYVCRRKVAGMPDGVGWVGG